MLKIWGRSNSINVQKVLWCCAELDISFQHADVGGTFGGNRDPEYLRLNPNGLIPTISDDGFVLWEANTIVRYLAAKHGMGTLCPGNLAEQADADRWMDWQMGTLWANFRPAFIGLVRTPPEERDETCIKVAISKTAENWSILDAHLADRNYITGTSLTMADIPLGVTAYHWFNLDIERPPLGCCVFVCVLTVTRTVTIFLQTKLRTMALILLLHRRRVARSAGLEPATF